MKEMNKAKIYIKKSMKSILNEKKFLEKINYPLLSNMYYAFQNKEDLFIILDFIIIIKIDLLKIYTNKKNKRKNL